MTQRTQAFLSLSVAALLAAPAAWAAPEGGGGGNIFAGDIGNAVWTVIIFLAVLFVLGKYAWGPLLSGLQSRETYIRESLETARRDRTEAEARLKEYQDKLATARTEATAIIEEGRRDAEAVKKKIEQHAKEEADRMIERARREIHSATVEATRELYSLSASLATDLASRVLGREVNSQDHDRLIAESIADLSARHN
jgi:F-type H+-transporting ATPase subunit b